MQISSDQKNILDTYQKLSTDGCGIVSELIVSYGGCFQQAVGGRGGFKSEVRD